MSTFEHKAGTAIECLSVSQMKWQLRGKTKMNCFLDTNKTDKRDML